MKQMLILFIGLLMIGCDSVEPENNRGVWIGYHEKDTISIDNGSKISAIVIISSVKSPFIGVFNNDSYMNGEIGYYNLEFWYSITDKMQGRFVLYHYGDVIIDTHLVLERQWR
ncbi:hypothetical protein LCGC14_2479750 [marine sediment metagenome]|uniref:Uncharacterized protein n=1 Tax=marine sediment metagenome TaxID=412755 RepID=A0A0F9B7X9_9ZZZZ